MNCPVCGEEMEKGAIYGSIATGVPWLPGNAKFQIRLTVISVEKRRGIMLGKGIPPDSSFHLNCTLETYICRKCQKGVFSY